MKASGARADAVLDHALIRRLHEGHFDAAVIFTVYSQSALPAALMCYLANIPLRLAHCRENPYQVLTDWLREPEPQDRLRHEVRRQLDLVGHVGAAPDDDRLRMQLPAACFERAQQQLRTLGLDVDAPWVVMHAGASAPSRRYPAGGFAAAARSLVLEHGCNVVFTGTADEAELIAGIQRDMEVPSYSLAGKLDLGALCALIAMAPVLISNNTAPVHIAAAVDTPVVDLYALTNPQHMPWGVENRVLYHDVSCKYCYKSLCPAGHHHCLRLVSPRAIVEAALELLAYRSGIERRMRVGQ
jgi:lipopolysaccharide heptosyltransferase II